MSSLPTCDPADEGTQVYDKSTDLLYFYNGTQFKNSDSTLTSKVIII